MMEDLYLGFVLVLWSHLQQFHTEGVATLGWSKMNKHTKLPASWKSEIGSKLSLPGICQMICLGLYEKKHFCPIHDPFFLGSPPTFVPGC